MCTLLELFYEIQNVSRIWKSLSWFRVRIRQCWLVLQLPQITMFFFKSGQFWLEIIISFIQSKFVTHFYTSLFFLLSIQLFYKQSKFFKSGMEFRNRINQHNVATRLENNLFLWYVKPIVVFLPCQSPQFYFIIPYVKIKV